MKIELNLRPYDAISILSFLREYFNDSNRNISDFAAMHETIDSYEKELNNKMTKDMYQEVYLEDNINRIAQRIPIEE